MIWSGPQFREHSIGSSYQLIMTSNAKITKFREAIAHNRKKNMHFLSVKEEITKKKVLQERGYAMQTQTVNYKAGEIIGQNVVHKPEQITA